MSGLIGVGDHRQKLGDAGLQVHLRGFVWHATNLPNLLIDADMEKTTYS